MDYPKHPRVSSALSRRTLLQAGAAWGVVSGLDLRRGVAEQLPAEHAPGDRGITDTAHSPRARLRSLDMNAVTWRPGFWGERFDLVNRVMLESMWRMFNMPDNGTSFVTFRIAAGAPPETNYATPYSDGDFYKWLESVAHVYAVTRDAALDRRMDEVIAIIARAQRPDGYISTHVQIHGKKPWTDIRELELYNMGHLMTAACVHFRATGKRTLLNVATRAADYLYTTFSPRPPALAHFSSNPSQIMGLTELFRTTRNPRYLELALIFVDMPGSQPGGTDDRQDRIPLRQSTEAVGHAVIGQYLFAGAADVLAEKNDPELQAAVERLWHDVAYRKMYLTGGVGALHVGFSYSVNKQGVLVKGDTVNEAFGTPFELPSRTAYNETCANIANALWNWRMLTLTGDARHADIMERVFYNSLLSGVSLAGTEFFYSNPLRRDLSKPLQRNDTAVRWADTASRRPPGAPWSPACCCPSNLLRTLAGMHEYAYSSSDEGLWVHLYGASEMQAPLPSGVAHFEQHTDYPWDGRIVFTAGANVRGTFAVRLRIPEWAAGATLLVNGKPHPEPLRPATYAAVQRAWKPGDRLELTLPMEPRWMAASASVDDTRGQVAAMRGPIVYCLESPDVPHGLTLDDLAFDRQAPLEARHEPKLLGGITTLWVQARKQNPSSDGDALYRPAPTLAAETVPVRLIPYYAWSNRGPSSMAVWLALAV